LHPNLGVARNRFWNGSKRFAWTTRGLQTGYPHSWIGRTSE